ncbi:MAG: hypothetical protein LQ342_006331 [Letrouitia transgressa]|nr:MAG: hypothetical protein LQ342_006331 [Letrouitia transgressa]
MAGKQNGISAEDFHDTQAVKVLSDPDVRQFLRKYYYIANDISLDTEYAELFTEDAIFIMANRKAVGRSAVVSFRKKLWDEIPKRDHSPTKIFSLGNDDDDMELMVLGTAEWGYHAGHSKTGDWVAHVKLERDKDNKVLCSYYQIIMGLTATTRIPLSTRKNEYNMHWRQGEAAIVREENVEQQPK